MREKNGRTAGGSIRLEGMALHAGVATSVTFRRSESPLTFVQGERSARLDELSVDRTDAGVRLTHVRGLAIDLVEHVLAAAAGLGIRRHLAIEVGGPELPLMDGGARAFADALLALDLASSPPELEIVRSAELAMGDARYRFEPSASVAIEVEVSFAHPLIGLQRARWDGSAADFVARIAAARTFGFAKDAPSLWAAGRGRLAAASPLDAVVSFTESGVCEGSRPPEEGEVARHKLLDLVGDLAVYGGPPRGRIVASRPGHTPTHKIVRDALAQGILARR